MSEADIRLMFRLVIAGDYDKIKKEGYKARPDCSPVKVETPMLWLHKDSNVEFQMQSWRFLSAFWRRYLDNKDVSVLIEAVEIMSDWLEVSKSSRSKYLWYDMAAGLRAMHIGFLLKCQKEFGLVFTDNYKKVVSSLYVSHKKFLENKKNITKGNHAIYQILGLRLMADANDDRSTEGYCVSQIKKLLSDSFDSNYVCTENSPFYHKYNVSLIGSIKPLFPNSLSRIVVDIQENGRRLVKWFTSPEGELYMIGDTEGKGEALEERDVLESERLSDKLIFLDLQESGYQIIRTRPSVRKDKAEVLIFYGPSKSLVHAHAHHLSFILIANGIEIFTDPGKYTYENNEFRSYFVGDASHSTLGLAGRNFLPGEIRPGDCKLNPIKVERDSLELSGLVRKGDVLEHRREISYKAGEEILIRDFIATNEDDAPQARYCLSSKVDDVDVGGNGVRLFAEGVCIAEIEFKPTPAAIDVFKGDGRIGWISKEYNSKLASYILYVNYEKGLNKFETKVYFGRALKENVNKQCGFKKTGRAIKGFEEYSYKDCRFIYKKSHFSNIVAVGFSSIPEPGEEQKYKYLNVCIGKGISFCFFLDRDAPEPKKNGSYYLSPGCGFEYIENIQGVLGQIFPDVKRNDFLLLGSSKGASAALLFGLYSGYNRFLISAPQIRIATYLQGRDPLILKEILRGRPPQALDDLIVEKLRSRSIRDIDVTVFIDRDDKYHIGDLEYFEKELPELKLRKVETSGGHGGESAVHYQERLSAYLEASRKGGAFLESSCFENQDISVIITFSDHAVNAKIVPGALNSIPVYRQEYAFYLICENEKKKVVAYSKNNSASFPLKEGERQHYSITGFVRDSLSKRVEWKRVRL